MPGGTEKIGIADHGESWRGTLGGNVTGGPGGQNIAGGAVGASSCPHLQVGRGLHRIGELIFGGGAARKGEGWLPARDAGKGNVCRG